ncbi:MAG: OmpA family protein [Arcobacteraceae bacterium]
MKKIVLSSVLASTLLLSAQSKYEITPMIGYVDTKEKVDLENHGVAGIAVSRDLDKKYVVDQLELGLLQSGNIDYDNSSDDTKITQLFLNGVENYNITDSVKLYALAGLGYEYISNEEYKNDSDPFFNYGVGAAYVFENNFSLRADVRHLLKFDGDKNVLYTVGLGIPFGQKADKKVIEEAEEIAIVEVLDSDNDGVVDSLDKCPTTAAGVVVDTNGCEVLTVPADLGIVFETDSAKIKSSDIEKFEKYATYLKSDLDSKVVIEAHTDSVGNAHYNLGLSQKRAQSVMKKLVNMGIDANRIETIGYGETKPMVTNDTAENRAKNRRVTAKIKN